MTIIARLLSIAARIEARVAARARTRRERASLLAFAEMSDDRLHDLGLSREGLRCGLAARAEPMRAALACRTHAPLPLGMDALRDGARWGEPRVYPERHLGW